MTHVQDIAEDKNTVLKCSLCKRVITEGEGRYFLPGEKILCCGCVDNQRNKTSAPAHNR